MCKISGEDDKPWAQVVQLNLEANDISETNVKTRKTGGNHLLCPTKSNYLVVITICYRQFQSIVCSLDISLVHELSVEIIKKKDELF